MPRDLDDRLRAALRGQDVAALVDVGYDLADLGRQAEALICFQRAVAGGEDRAWFDVGNTLRELERPVEAVHAFEEALTAGETDAWLNLGHVLESLGDLAGAMRAYRCAGDLAGQPEGYVGLAHLLRDQGLHEDAEAALETVVDHAPTAALLAVWRWERTRDPALEDPLRAGAAVDGEARASLAELLVATGRREEARAQLELGARLGQHQCWLPLGNLLCGDDLDPASDRRACADADAAVDVDAAARAYRAGIAAGDVYCHHNLAMLLLDHHDPVGADAHLLAGAAAGDETAQLVWWELHRDDG